MNRLKFSCSLLIIISFLFNLNNIICIQLKLKLEKQVYQFPVNHILYRRLNEDPLRELYLYEYERPNIKLALPVLSIDIGTPPQNFSLIYSTGKQVSWVYKEKSNYDKLSQKYFDTLKSKTIIKYNEIYEINSFTFGTLCHKVQDYFSIKDINNKNKFNNNKTISTFMSFMLIFYLSPNSLFADGELSLMRKYRGIYSDPYITTNVSNFSFLEGLYKDNIIKNKTFSHKWNNKKNEGILFIDEFPLIEEEKPYYDFYICKAFNKLGEINQFWNCFIDGIKIGNNYINYSDINIYNETGIFSTSEKFIFIPERNKDIIDYIKNYSTWGENNCVLEGITAFKELHCNYKNFKYSYFPDIYINFNGYEIKLIYNKKDYWVFGSLLNK